MRHLTQKSVRILCEGCSRGLPRHASLLGARPRLTLSTTRKQRSRSSCPPQSQALGDGFYSAGLGWRQHLRPPLSSPGLGPAVPSGGSAPLTAPFPPPAPPRPPTVAARSLRCCYGSAGGGSQSGGGEVNLSLLLRARRAGRPMGRKREAGPRPPWRREQRGGLRAPQRAPAWRKRPGSGGGAGRPCCRAGEGWRGTER